MIKKTLFKKQNQFRLHNIISQYKSEEKDKKYEKNYSNSNKTKLTTLSNVRGQYRYSKTKPIGFILNIKQ